MVNAMSPGPAQPRLQPGLVVSGLHVSYEGSALLRNIDLEVAPDEIVALLGASGSGKSTLLRVIAGVQQPDAGRVLWGGEDLAGVPAHRRRIGLVFQDALLFPHLDVGSNVAFGLVGRPRAEMDRRVGDLLELVGLAGFQRRAVTTLSGGEAQRVALARALAPGPRMLLLDEPFGALDRELRDRLAVEVRDLLHSLGTPAVHVTHDLAEAEMVADRVLRPFDV
jgi:thiamine transport system ATP-binding protein